MVGQKSELGARAGMAHQRIYNSTSRLDREKDRHPALDVGGFGSR